MKQKKLTAAMDSSDAWKLGEAFVATKQESKIGDMIDRGLVLLRELNALGFDVVRRGEPEREELAADLGGES